MPHIIVTADRPDDRGDGAVMLIERINPSDFESRHFASQLVERLGWAVGDAHDAERAAEAQSLDRAAEAQSLDRAAEAQSHQSEADRLSASVVTTAS